MLNRMLGSIAREKELDIRIIVVSLFLFSINMVLQSQISARVAQSSVMTTPGAIGTWILSKDHSPMWIPGALLSVIFTCLGFLY